MKTSDVIPDIQNMNFLKSEGHRQLGGHCSVGGASRLVGAFLRRKHGIHNRIVTQSTTWFAGLNLRFGGRKALPERTIRADG
jgi:hypothetical protein